MNDSDAIIVQAVPADLDGICAIEALSFGSDAFSGRQLAYLVSKAKGRFLVAKDEQRIRGYISMIANSRTRNLRIYSIAVHPTARGKGLAERMLREAEKYAAMSGRDKITLEVSIGNAAAIALYAKNGYVRTALRRSYYPDGSDAFVMTKKLF